MRRDAQGRAGSLFVAGTKYVEIDSVSNDARVGDCRNQHGFLDSIHQPAGRCCDMQAAVGEDFRFAGPIERRCVARQCRIDAEIGTAAAASLPSIAVEGVGAMPAQQPRIVHRREHRGFAAQERQSAKIEEAAVKIVKLEDVGDLRRQAEKAPGCRKIEVFMTAHDIAIPSGLTETQAYPCVCPSGSGKLSAQRIKQV